MAGPDIFQIGQKKVLFPSFLANTETIFPMNRTSSEFSTVFRQKRYALQNETPPILNCIL